MAGNNTLTFTDDGFDKEVLGSDFPVRLIFGRNGVGRAA